MRIIKLASVNVSVKDFNYPEELYDLGSVTYKLMQTLWTQLQSILNGAEFNYFSDNRIGEYIAPDGEDFFKPTGTINLYLSGLPKEKLPNIIAALKFLMKEINIEPGAVSGIENSGAYSSQVVRIEAVKNDNKETQDGPPEINMSNSNASEVLGALNYRMEDGSICIDAWEIIRRIDNTIPQTIDEYVRPPTDEKSEGGARVIDMGTNAEYIKEKMDRIKDIAQWAVDNNYRQICIG
jgi:hypothetical protein